MKECTKCKITQELNQFHKDKYSNDGHKLRCKKCRLRDNIYHSIMSRCYKTNNLRYKDYGGRGITVCDEWLTLNGMRPWLNENWVQGLQIDRIDNEKGYSPSNCHFVTNQVNALNRRIRKNGTSIYRGVSYNSGRSKFVAISTLNGKNTHIGYYATEKEAYIAYDNYIILNKLPNKLNEVLYDN